MKAGIFKPLKQQAFRSLFGAQVFSDLGNWLDFIALQVVVAYHWGLGASAIAAVIIMLGLPWVIIGPFASVFIDRLPKKLILISCLILRIVFVAGLYFSPNLYILLLFVFLKGAAAALYDPARQSMIRMTVPEDQLPEAVTLSQLSVNTMKIVGPALGGGLIALLGAKSPFIFEAIGFCIALLFLLTLPKYDLFTEKNVDGRDTTNYESKPSYLSQLLEGLRHILAIRILKVSIIISSIAFFIIFLYDGLFVFIAQNLGFTHGNFSLLISAVGFGSVIGSLLLGHWTNWKHSPISFMAGNSLIGGALIVSIGLGSMGIFHFSKIIWIVFAFLLGLSGSAQSVPYGYILQSQTPKHMMARVSSAAVSIQTLSMLVAPAAGALFAKWLGVSIVLVSAGIATCFLGVFLLIKFAQKLSAINPQQKGV